MQPLKAMEQQMERLFGDGKPEPHKKNEQPGKEKSIGSSKVHAT
jgi:hypothetical protein